MATAETTPQDLILFVMENNPELWHHSYILQSVKFYENIIADAFQAISFAQSLNNV